ncbi:MAG TPA: cell division protein FtsA [Syntrophorhabdaceae bacterium]|nr:cell division protein FtsA [Syntrophorhabdaceae bacterium]HQM81317.1 cell division protein FtsA [Syntrophorhabdaceae bacterium]
MLRDDDLLVGLDIGTTKICVVVGKVVDGKVSIIGIGSHPSTGLRKGVVVNMDSTVNSIKKAVEEAELMAGIAINSCLAGIGGAHIKSFNSNGVVAVKDKEVKQDDIVRAIDAAKAVAIPADRELIHVIPQEFIVDDQDGIKDPIGITGVRLEVKVHIVTGSISSAQNVIKCCKLAGLEVDDIVLGQLASSEATLTPEEKEIGVALVDTGGGTSDIAIYSNGSIAYTSVLPFGGNNITNDIAIGLRTPLEEAEKIKKKYGCAFAGMIGANETIEVPSVGGRKPRTLQRKTLADIIEPRVEEISLLIYEEIKKSGLERLLASGVVLTGGCANLEGIPELVENIFNLPSRRGYPIGVGGLTDVVNNPIYSTGVGLLLYGFKSSKSSKRGYGQGRSIKKLFNGQKLLGRMREWFKEIF